MQRFAAEGLTINLVDLLAHASDSDGDALAVIGVSSNSASGGSVRLRADGVSYLPPYGFTNTDTFGFTVSDGHCGGTAVGTVIVEVKVSGSQVASFTIQHLGDGGNLLRFTGLDGWTYRLQYTESLENPSWQDLATNRIFGKRGSVAGGTQRADHAGPRQARDGYLFFSSYLPSRRSRISACAGMKHACVSRRPAPSATFMIDRGSDTSCCRPARWPISCAPVSANEPA